MIMNAKMMKGRAYEYINQLLPGMSEALRLSIVSNTPVHFYGKGLGKTTLCQSLKKIGVKNISEAGELDGPRGCFEIPEGFSGLLLRFDVEQIPPDPPSVAELPEILRFWI